MKDAPACAYSAWGDTWEARRRSGYQVLGIYGHCVTAGALTRLASRLWRPEELNLPRMLRADLGRSMIARLSGLSRKPC